ncbi:hypothetical protein B6I21_05300 [candidate division KSB1 bacterium 4572_119]|nr:MAG: hypothetical protein B6I21_05300 [candidate division KSB1 bacterium 4572_119]
MSNEIVEVDFQLPAIKVINHLCKGCGLCIEHCPKNCIEFSGKFNQLGYDYAQYNGEGCTGCSICFYACPEPGAIEVYKKVKGE